MLDGLRQPRDEDGMTLIEILIALIIMSVAVVTLVGALGSLLISTQHHRGLGSTDTVVRDWGEAVKERAIHDFTFAQCPQWTDLDPGAAFTMPVDFSQSGTPVVEYWIPADQSDPKVGTFENRAACLDYYDDINCTEVIAQCDPGFQRVTLTVQADAANLKGAKASTQVLLRRGNP